MQTLAWSLFDPAAGQGGRQFAEIGIALLLSTLIGAERAIQQKSAGLRTHTLVGVGSALFMEVSQHGFNSVLGLDQVSFDPSRVAAQIVSGIGFIGGGLIFVRRDAVRGLTTAATVWLTCAIGMACGGGLPLLAVAATLVHFLVVRGYPWVTRRIPALASVGQADVRLTYRAGEGVLPRVLEHCTDKGFRVLQVHVDSRERVARSGWGAEGADDADVRDATRTVRLEIDGPGNANDLVGALAEFDGVLDVAAHATDSAD
ncbi:MgtC/SapB family protein [Streptomyces tsukubensis]|uniref:Magnesium transporter MgtC n=1 Tax=Streptomyces tsukubensis TaxID=83656 RepID=A0A1V4A875_9ACTN|nr:MgtC/SapB family protein [Streptomyces tsukubensis]OON78040.1 magnesium transporter MgtC [Streptomyces tsukubensis]QFR97205.1 MgtC/SapB family protein [Streptomyces tsukubensis]